MAVTGGTDPGAGRAVAGDQAPDVEEAPGVEEVPGEGEVPGVGTAPAREQTVPAVVQATAYLAAACRAVETARPAPRLRDPLAQRFVAARPPQVPELRPLLAAGGEEVVARTALLDQLLTAQVTTGTAPVLVNLAAGFCTRPYRLDLAGCRLVLELDAAPVLAVKRKVLAGERPTCPVVRVDLDLRDRAALLATLTRWCADASPVVLVSEGLLPYLTEPAVSGLAATLAATPGQVVWLTDLVSVESARGMGEAARAAGAGLRVHGLASLAPLERHGWTVDDYRILAVPRRRPPAGPGGGGPPVPASQQVVDGVAVLRPGRSGSGPLAAS